MIYSEEQIKSIKELAQSLTPISEIAVLLDLDARQLRMDVADELHPASKAYHLGKAETALQIRRNELQLAEAGSPLAVQLMSGYLHNMDADEDL